MTDIEELRPFVEQSPYFALLGLKLGEWVDGRATLVLDVEDRHLNGQGYLHGGGVASLIDAAGGLAAVAAVLPKATTVTMEMKVNYFAPIRKGRVTATARIVHRGQRSIVTDVEARVGDTLVAKGTVTSMILSWDDLR